MKKICPVLWGICLTVLSYTACSSEDVIEQILKEGVNFQGDSGGGLGTNSTSTESPVFLGYKALSPTELSFQFSLPVTVRSLNFDPPAEVEGVDEGDTVTVTLSEPLKGGERFVADILVEDGRRNTLNVLIPFRARNERIPEFLITELRTEVSKLKVEFVELKTLSAGNLGALRLFITTNSMDIPVFEFPPVEVAEGEYLVVHLRSAEAGISNELEDDLGESGGTETNPESRDFWVPEAEERFRKTDAVYLLDQDDRIIDGVIFSETADAWWTKETLAAAAEFLSEQGAWMPISAAGSEEDPPAGNAGAIPGPADAVNSSKTTNTRSICRDETLPDSNTAADWYITVTSGATPGRPNNPNRFVVQ
ncbi:MAG: hypothetical protein LBP43_05735 [Treponema sp.]|jgi:hypothetical protein|nr:hypothetical protein [Treponema sp.]